MKVQFKQKTILPDHCWAREMNQEFNINPGYPDAFDHRILWWSYIQKSNGVRLSVKT